MNTYTWLIDSLECYPMAESQSNVVCNVHWRVNATDGVHNATIYGVQPIDYVDGKSFTPFENLSLNEVIGWVQSAIGETEVAAIQIGLNNQINNLANPTVIFPALPWSV